jgi:hypothetical protein
MRISLLREWLSTIIAVVSCIGVGFGSWVGYSNSVVALQQQTQALTKRADIQYEKMTVLTSSHEQLKERVIRNESDVTYLNKGLADVSSNLLHLTDEMKTLNQTLLKIVIKQDMESEEKDG